MDQEEELEQDQEQEPRNVQIQVGSTLRLSGDVTLTVTCPGCGGQAPLDSPWFVMDKPYCSAQCANKNALA